MSMIEFGQVLTAMVEEIKKIFGTNFFPKSVVPFRSVLANLKMELVPFRSMEIRN